MCEFKQDNVEDYYEVTEEIGRLDKNMQKKYLRILIKKYKRVNTGFSPPHENSGKFMKNKIFKKPHKILDKI